MTVSEFPKTIRILLVEDNPMDARLTVAALERRMPIDEIAVVTDGQQALEYLRREAKFSDAFRPDIVLLDLNLPKISGREVLAEMKCDENLRSIPVIVLTTSDAEEDIAEAYRLQASCYITKPVCPEDFMKRIYAIEDFWLSTAELPPQETQA